VATIDANNDDSILVDVGAFSHSLAEFETFAATFCTTTTAQQWARRLRFRHSASNDRLGRYRRLIHTASRISVVSTEPYGSGAH